MKILAFEVAGQRFGLPLAQIREVVRAVAITPLPGAPSMVEGVVDFRGDVVVVVDIRARLALPVKPLDPSDHLVIARGGVRLLGLRVEQATEVLEVEDAAVEPAPAAWSDLAPIAGVAKLPDGLLLIQDLDAFLTAAEDEAVDAALSSGT